jgi:hypothetical protein
MNYDIYNDLKNLDIKINILKNSDEIGIIELNKDNNLQCAICLKKIAINKNYKKLPKCNHKFHIKCINQWLEKNNSCPSCRLNY